MVRSMLLETALSNITTVALWLAPFIKDRSGNKGQKGVRYTNRGKQSVNLLRENIPAL